MRKKILFGCLLLLGFNGLSQVSQSSTGVAINTTGADANPSALLDVSGAGKGVLIPRMTMSERPSNPVVGLMIYQTDNTPGFYYYDGTSWKAVGGSSGGSSASKTIIPIASGVPALATTIDGGLPGNGAVIGFGSVRNNVNVTKSIDLTGTGSSSEAINMAFTVPCDGKITGVSAFFSSTAALSLVGTTLSNEVVIYSNGGSGNVFTPIAGTNVICAPQLTGILALGTTNSGVVSGLAIPVTAGTRLLFVHKASATGISLGITLSGYVSGSILFEPN